jgi:hypothetical protein
MNVQEIAAEPRPDFLEVHYTLRELSQSWQVSMRSLRPHFTDEPGVVKFGVPGLTRGRKRPYVSLRIPASVAQRVYFRMTGKNIPAGRGAKPTNAA